MKQSPSSSRHFPQLSHLTDAQFSDLLAGSSLDSDSEAHLTACPACRADAKALVSSVAEFNVFSNTWAEREAPRRVRTPSRWALRLSAHPAWNTGLMAVAASIALTVGFYLPQHTASPIPAAGAQAKIAAPAVTDLAADNRLLSSIDQELSYNTEPSVPLADLKNAGHHAPADTLEAVAN